MIKDRIKILKFCVCCISLLCFTVQGQGQGQDVDTIIRERPVLSYDFSSEDDLAKYPLKPPDTRSPRGTLRSFIQSMNRSHRILMEAYERNNELSLISNSQVVDDLEEQAEILFSRATSCLDLSNIPEAILADLTYEKAILLKEVLDRIDLPSPNEVPGLVDLQDDSETEKLIQKNQYWIPNTDIIIGRIAEGPRAGEYLFSSRTVGQLEDYYKKVADLPYRKDRNTSKNFYSFYISTPGSLLPPRWVRFLPDFLTNKTYLSQTPWQWLGFVLTLIALIFIIQFTFKKIIKIFGFDVKDKNLWQKGFFSLIVCLSIIILYFVDETFLNLTGTVLLILRYTFSSVFWIFLAIAIFFFINAIGETLANTNRLELKGIQLAYSRAVLFVFSVLFSIIIIVIGLFQVGISLIPLFTGIGIGGIAVAVAAKSALENIIGSFVIFSNKPYRMGHQIQVLGHEGWVEEIGLNATKLRLLDGELAVIPNQNIIGAEITNLTERPYFRRVFEIQLSYSDNPNTIRHAIEIVEEILSMPSSGKNTREHPNSKINMPGHSPKVFVNNLKSDNQVIKIFYWCFTADIWEFRKFNHQINSQIIEHFNAEGIEFAIPSRRIEIKSQTDQPKSD